MKPKRAAENFLPEIQAEQLVTESLNALTCCQYGGLLVVCELQ